MKKTLGVLTVLLAVIAIAVRAEAKNLIRFFSIRDLLSFLFDPIFIISLVILILGIYLIKNNEKIDLSIDNLFVLFGIHIKNKSVGIGLLIAGLITLIVELIIWGGILKQFSVSGFGVLLFDDAKMPITAIATFAIITGIYLLVNGGKTK